MERSGASEVEQTNWKISLSIVALSIAILLGINIEQNFFYFFIDCQVIYEQLNQTG